MMHCILKDILINKPLSSDGKNEETVHHPNKVSEFNLINHDNVLRKISPKNNKQKVDFNLSKIIHPFDSYKPSPML
jgi:hypothetical protein